MDTTSSSETGEWNYDVHRAFVECIFMDGLKACSPSLLMEQMHIKAEYITSERVKSHLQKFRRNKQRSVEEFMAAYETSLDLYKERCCREHRKMSQDDLYRVTNDFISSSKIGALTSGEVAAYLTMADMVCTNTAGTYSSISTKNDTGAELQNSMVTGSDSCNAVAAATAVTNVSDTKQAEACLQNVASMDPPVFMSKFMDGKFESDSIELPVLTDSEKNTSLGVILCYVMGLFFSLKQRILDERQKKTDATRTRNFDNSKGNSVGLNCSTTPTDTSSSKSHVIGALKQQKSVLQPGANLRINYNHLQGPQKLDVKQQSQEITETAMYHQQIIENQKLPVHPAAAGPRHHELHSQLATYPYHGFNMFRDATYYHENNHRGEDQDLKMFQWQIQQQHYYYNMKRDQYSMLLPTESTPKASSRRDPIFRQKAEDNLNPTIQSRLSFDRQLSMERFNMNDGNRTSHDYSTDDFEPYQIPPRNRALSLSLHSLDFDVKDSDDSSTDSSTGGENKIQKSNSSDHKRKYDDTDPPSNKNSRKNNGAKNGDKDRSIMD